MEDWIIYALLWSIIIWIYWFLQKIQTESKVNRNAFIIYSHLWMVIYPLLYSFVSGKSIVFDMTIFSFAFVLTSIYVVIMIFRLKSLKYLDSSTFFINYRIFSSILLIVLWQIIYSEVINIREYIWIFIGFIIFYLLLEKKYSREPMNNFIKWYLYLGIWVLWVSTIWIIQKYFVLQDLDFMSYMFFSWTVGIFMTILFNWKTDSLKEMLKVSKRKDILFLLISALLFPFWMLFNLLAVKSGGDVAIVYKIISYSLFIPIILSIIVYKEKVTTKKVLAFILTVFSILLFIE